LGPPEDFFQAKVGVEAVIEFGSEPILTKSKLALGAWKQHLLQPGSVGFQSGYSLVLNGHKLQSQFRSLLEIATQLVSHHLDCSLILQNGCLRVNPRTVPQISPGGLNHPWDSSKSFPKVDHSRLKGSKIPCDQAVDGPTRTIAERIPDVLSENFQLEDVSFNIGNQNIPVNLVRVIELGGIRRGEQRQIATMKPQLVMEGNQGIVFEPIIEAVIAQRRGQLRVHLQEFFDILVCQ